MSEQWRLEVAAGLMLAGRRSYLVVCGQMGYVGYVDTANISIVYI
jgi:hypothetical protein